MIFYNYKHKIYLGTYKDFLIKEGAPKHVWKNSSLKNELRFVDYNKRDLWGDVSLSLYPDREIREELKEWYKNKVSAYYFSKLLPPIMAIIAFLFYFFGIDYPQNILPSIVGPSLILWYFHREPENV